MTHDEGMKKGLKQGKTSADSLPDGARDAFNDATNQNDHNMNEYQFVYDLIPTGQSNAISMPELAGLIMSSQRALRMIIAEMRIQGFLICGDSHGYYKPASTGELERWYRSAQSRASSTLKGLEKAHDVLKEHALFKDEIER